MSSLGTIQILSALPAIGLPIAISMLDTLEPPPAGHEASWYGRDREIQ